MNVMASRDLTALPMRPSCGSAGNIPSKGCRICKHVSRAVTQRWAGVHGKQTPCAFAELGVIQPSPKNAHPPHRKKTNLR